MVTSKEQQRKICGHTTLNPASLMKAILRHSLRPLLELMAFSLIYLQVALFVWLCACVSKQPPSVCIARLDQPLSSLFRFPFPPCLAACSSYLPLRARVRPLSAILYSDLPWWSSIKTSFSLLGSNSGCDCMWLYCFGYSMHQSRTQAASCRCHPQLLLSLLNLLLLFFFALLSPSITLFLIRWEQHTFPPVMRQF